MLIAVILLPKPNDYSRQSRRGQSSIRGLKAFNSDRAQYRNVEEVDGSKSLH
jgi:hypothetical protein